MGQRWSDAAYYGIRTKRYFKYLDTMLKKLFKEAESNNTIDDVKLEQILKITARQNNLTHTITKLSESMDVLKRIEDIEKLLQAVTPEALAKAQRVISWDGR